MMDPKVQTELIQKALEELGLADASLAVQTHFLNQIGSLVFRRVSLETIKRLPEDVLPEFQRLREADDMPGLQALIKTHIPDFDTWVQEVARGEIEALKAASGSKPSS